MTRLADQPQDDLEIRQEVTVYDVLVPVWRYRKLTCWMAAAGLLFAVLYQFIATPLYTAQVLIAPVPNDLTLSQTGNSIAGLSLLSSVSGGGSGPTDFDLFQSLVQSPAIAKQLDRKYHVKRVIFSGKWDDRKKQWAPEKEFFLFRIARLILNMPWHPPTDDDLAKYLSKNISVSPQDPFTLLSFDYKDPNVAKLILGGALNEARNVIRDQQHRRADAALSFLDRQLQTTASSMAQQALIALAIQWEQKKLLAENDLDVGVEIAQPLTVSSYPTSPYAPFDLAVGLALGAFIGIVLSVFLGLFASEDPRVVWDWIVERVHRLTDRFRGGVRGKPYRLER